MRIKVKKFKESTVVIFILIVGFLMFMLGYKTGLEYMHPKKPTCYPIHKVNMQKDGTAIEIVKANPDQVFLTCY